MPLDRVVCPLDIRRIGESLFATKCSGIVIALLVASASSGLLPKVVLSSPIATIQFDPQDSYVAVGQTFTVNVSIVDVSNLTAWMFTVYFNNSVLNCVNASEGPFLSAVAGPYGTTFIKRINNTFSSTYGAVDVGCSLLGSNVSASGSGVLATVEFEAMSRGNTLLHLTNIELDDNSFPPQIIPYNSVDGMVYVSGGLIPGDLNVDGYVNAKDAVILGTAFGSRPSDPNWNSNADINGDGIVNAKDAVILGTHFGQGP